MINGKIKYNWEQYLGCCHVEYAYDLAMRLHPLVNADLGGRNAGSDAEHQAAEMLYKEMLDIGLEDVRKEWFPVVRWQFNDCTLTVMSENKQSKFSINPMPTLPEAHRLKASRVNWCMQAVGPSRTCWTWT